MGKPPFPVMEFKMKTEMFLMCALFVLVAVASVSAMTGIVRSDATGMPTIAKATQASPGGSQAG